MPEETPAPCSRWRWLAAEWVLLALAAPFLLFPTLKPLLTLLALGLLGLFWLVALWRRCPWPCTPFNGAVFLVALMVAVGTLVTQSPDLSLPKATGLILGLAVFRAVAQMGGRERLKWALAGLLLAALGVWVLGLLDLRWPDKISGMQALLNHVPRHVTSLPDTPEGGVSPNQLAGVLAMLLPIPLAAVVANGWPRRSFSAMLLGLGGVVIWGGTLFLTQSRGGWVGGLAGVLVFFTLWGASGQRRWQRAVGLALPALALLVVIVALLALGSERIGQVLYGATEGAVETTVGSISFQGRMEIWSRALRTIRHFPLTGCGLGTFRRAVHLLYPLVLVSPDWDIAHAHNVFLQVALDLGLPGLVGYLATLAVAGWAGWRRAKAGGADRWLALGVLAGLVGYHVYGIADTVALGSKPSFLFWWLLGLLAAMNAGLTYRSEAASSTAGER
ncbi:MAG: O-antigen ligase family protein [Anaerolineae bacterium]|nr:O-antigen ligase family protein [Anaerolineae bacterium]